MSLPVGKQDPAFADTGIFAIGKRHDDPDVAFVLGMIPHHQGAIDMARIQLAAGSDRVNRALAQHIIAEQQKEIDAMRAWLRQRGIESE
ncbi:CopM family metallochaperone [Martelella radicis]|uniref:Uncharacterized protein (DUF305 family) n=1 Tax=Martelella radicis TaxID=1397476 RepID=A0A7W6PBM0_9HYPH|nr:DUF305 domain-containing protein [Martelella radicis]MBB4124627.1 uncharacterized protein (DUF305 family) [Martelella radicis]